MKKTIAAMLLMAVMSFLPMAAGATNNKVSDGDKIYTVAEQMPSFKGNGAKWISQNLRKPVGNGGEELSGRVILKIVIEKDGSVGKVKVERSVAPALDKEAVRVVKSMPKWNPAMNGGKPVRCYFMLPVNFSAR
ncbi:MAG: energy transducer TonB [Prevotella sp.]|nr:energy transducer TonB [Prevotella sp.]